MSMALHPNFPATPYVYVYYVRDAPIGGTAPAGPGATDAARTRRAAPTTAASSAVACRKLTASGNTITSEQVLVEDWCQQYPSHAGGGLALRRGRLPLLLRR